jgi:translation initiation factor IF-1
MTGGCKYFLHFRWISFFYQTPTLFFMSSEQPIELEGTVRTVLPGTMFRVTLDNQHEVLAHMSGKMRKHFVRLTVGDRVRLEMSPYDLSKARITYRLR